MIRAIVLGGILALTAVASAAAQSKAPPEDVQLYFVWPKDGQVIEGGKLWLRMGLKNMGVAPAGVEKEHTGHHHLLVDADLPPLDEPIPNDRNHLHFGGGQTETTIELPPGKHTLLLVMGDHAHVPHEPPASPRRSPSPSDSRLAA